MPGVAGAARVAPAGCGTAPGGRAPECLLFEFVEAQPQADRFGDEILGLTRPIVNQPIGLAARAS